MNIKPQTLPNSAVMGNLVLLESFSMFRQSFSNRLVCKKHTSFTLCIKTGAEVLSVLYC